MFVLDSVDVERMEEAKMELMRTAKCPDNQVRTTGQCNTIHHHMGNQSQLPKGGMHKLPADRNVSCDKRHRAAINGSCSIDVEFMMSVTRLSATE